MKKNITVFVAMGLLLLASCISFGLMRSTDAAQGLAEDIHEAHGRVGAKVGGQKYYIAPFAVEKVIGSNQTLSNDFVSSFQRSLYDGYRDLSIWDMFFSPEEITAKAAELQAKTSSKAYEVQHRMIARALGANFLVLGKFSYMGLGGGWLAEAELITSSGRVLAKEEASFNP